MPNPISFIVSGSGTINAFANGRQYVIPRTHRNYDRAKAALATNDADTFIRAVDYQEILKTIVPPIHKVQILGDAVYLNGQPLHNVITERILALSRDGFPWAPVGNFLDNIQQNPSYRAIQELYKFLEHRVLPITENGHFLAYKAVRPDWMDKHSGTFDNSVGQTVRMPRNQVNDDAREGCSNGLHVGSIEYVKDFKDSSDHIVICRVNPRDVVSVPFDSNCTKLRCCEYVVIGEYTGDLTGLVYTAQGNAVPPPSRNDPAQAVTQAPPPRDGSSWGTGLDPAIPGSDKTVVSVFDHDAGTIDTYTLDADQAKNDSDKASAFEFTDGGVGLGPKIEDDEVVIDDDNSDLEEDDSDLEDYDSDMEDDGFQYEDSDLEEEDSAFGPGSDLEDSDEFGADLEDEVPLAEPVTDGADTDGYAYQFNREYDDAPETFGGES